MLIRLSHTNRGDREVGRETHGEFIDRVATPELRPWSATE